MSSTCPVLVLSAPGFGVRPSCPPLTPLTASLNFLRRRRNPMADRLGYRSTRGSGLRGLGGVERAFAVRTVLLWPLVAAAPPKGKLLIAMPAFVLVTVWLSLKTEPASASGPGPAVTVLVWPKKLNPAFTSPGPPALMVLPPPPPLRATLRCLVH